MTSPEIYDRDYFERGPETGKSLYRNYRWMPWQTAVMAHSIIEGFRLNPGSRVLDVGCAKGFLVRALRFFDMEAEGCDVSSYAIEHADRQARPHLHRMTPGYLRRRCGRFDLTVLKDVLEHVEDPAGLLADLHSRTRQILVVVPLGDGGRFRIEEYGQDATHRHAQPLAWWQGVLERAGYSLGRCSYRWAGIKDHWYDVHERGNGFLVGSAV